MQCVSYYKKSKAPTGGILEGASVPLLGAALLFTPGGQCNV
jgi:hypothetical protein